MSEVDIERIKGDIAAFNEGDSERLLDMLDEDVELQRLGGLETLRGREAIRSWLAPDAIEYQRGQPVEFRQNGERILVTSDHRVRGSGSGVEVATRIFLVFTPRADKVIRIAVHQKEAEALQAAGLRE